MVRANLMRIVTRNAENLNKRFVENVEGSFFGNATAILKVEYRPCKRKKENNDNVSIMFLQGAAMSCIYLWQTANH